MLLEDAFIDRVFMKPSIKGIQPKPAGPWSAYIPKDEGGLGVIDIEKHNQALLLKNLHNIFNKSDIPWFHLIWEELTLMAGCQNTQKRRSFWRRQIERLADLQRNGFGGCQKWSNMFVLARYLGKCEFESQLAWTFLFCQNQVHLSGKGMESEESKSTHSPSNV